MDETGFLKCVCQKCGGHIEFPADGMGLTVDCPHCGAQMTLTAARENPPEPPVSLAAKKYLMAGGVVLVALAAALGTAFLFKKSKGTAVVPNITTNPVVVAKTNPPPADLRNEFDVGKISLQKTDGSSLVYAVGTVKNPLDRQRFGVRIELKLLDEQGENIGSASDYTSVMEPRAEWRFKALLTQPKAARATLADISEQK